MTDSPAPGVVGPFDGTELDGWVGTWDLTWDGGRGTNRLDWILGGRVLHERFEGASDDGSGALHGESWSVFDPTRGAWFQTWVDDQGSYLDLVGDRVDGWFAFVRAAPERGPRWRQRMVFRDVTADGLRWTWESSDDDGVTWTLRWEIHYRRAVAA